METTKYNKCNWAIDKQCSYPTYEEWKPSLDEEQRMKLFGSYPTYEEWKQYVF